MAPDPFPPIVIGSDMREIRDYCLRKGLRPRFPDVLCVPVSQLNRITGIHTPNRLQVVVLSVGNKHDEVVEWLLCLSNPGATAAARKLQGQANGPEG